MQAEETAAMRNGEQLQSFPTNAISQDNTFSETVNINSGKGKNTDSEREQNSNMANSKPKKQRKKGKKTMKTKGSTQSLKSLQSLDDEIEEQNPELPVAVTKGKRSSRVKASSFSLPGIVGCTLRGPDKDSPMQAKVKNSENLASKSKFTIETEGRQKPKRRRVRISDGTKSVGRGRLPNADTDKKYVEAVQIYGKDFVSIASYTNRTVHAAKKYWDRHSKRLELEKLVEDPVDKPQPSNSAAQHHELDSERWIPLIQSLPSLDLAQINKDMVEYSGIIDYMRAKVTNASMKEIYYLREFASVNIDDQMEDGAIVDAVRKAKEIFEKNQNPAYNTSQKNDDGSKQKHQGGKKGKAQVWSEADKTALVEAFNKHGRNWDLLRKAVPEKSLSQIKNFYQNYKSRYFMSPEQQGNDRKRKSSFEATSQASGNESKTEWSSLKRGKTEDVEVEKQNEESTETGNPQQNFSFVLGKFSTLQTQQNLLQQLLQAVPSNGADIDIEALTFQLSDIKTPAAQMQFNALIMMQLAAMASDNTENAPGVNAQSIMEMIRTAKAQMNTIVEPKEAETKISPDHDALNGRKPTETAGTIQKTEDSPKASG